MPTRTTAPRLPAPSASKTTTNSVAPIVRSGTRSGGQRIDRRAETEMSARFGHDFRNVRIHTNAEASASAEALQSRAYTTGEDVVFRAGQYNPSSAEGRELLAHELAHVVQQDRGRRQGKHGSATVSSPLDPAEQEAESTAEAASSAQTGSKTDLAADLHSVAPNTVHRAFWNGDNMKDDFWGTKEVLGQKWGGVADAGMSTAWDIAGVIPGVGTASSLVGSGIDFGKSIYSSGVALGKGMGGDLDGADQAMSAATRFGKDGLVDAAGAIPIWGTGQSAVAGLWDGASTIDRATGGKPAPLSGDIFTGDAE